MKEDLLEKEIKKFTMILQRLAGMLIKGDFGETLETTAQQYNEQLIDDFLVNKNFDPFNRFGLKELAFQIDLMYYRLIAQYKSGTVNEVFRQKFLAAAQKLVLMNNATFDFSLKMKMDEIENL